VVADRCEIVLRETVADDIPIFFAFEHDPGASAMAGVPARSWDAHANHWARIMDDDTILLRTILVGGVVAGNVVSFSESFPREVGYWLGRGYWNQGIATRALAAFLTIERTRPLHGCVAAHNVASRRVLEKCGFTVVAGDAVEYELVLHS
jgi:RimJ/RimL family protein N-acetyltransferase